MYNFKDLIAKIYIEHDKGKENNIAHSFYQEFHQVREHIDNDLIFSKEKFYEKIFKEVKSLITSCKNNYDIDLTHYPDAYIEPKNFDAWETDYLKKIQVTYNNMGIDFTVKPRNWEEVTDAKALNEALINGLNIDDPIIILWSGKDIKYDDVVLRKSKLEYLLIEAKRAKKAKNIAELDDEQSTNVESETISPDSSIDSRPKREDVIQSIVIKALEFVKPLGGFYLGVDLLDVANMERLNNYIRSIILTGKLPSDASSFPKIEVPAQFIRKTIHYIYKSIGNKHKQEFVNLVHLFEDFKDSETTTTSRKFSSYEGTYNKVLTDISY